LIIKEVKMMRHFNLIIISLLAFFLVGCATTNEQVKLKYSPRLRHYPHASHAKTLSVNKFTDVRGGNPNLITHKINEDYQQASGMYLAEKSLADILTQGLKMTLTKAGYKLTKHGDYVLDSELLRVHTFYDSGLISYTDHFSLQVEFTLTNRKTGAQVWDKILTGYSKYSSSEHREHPLRIEFRRAVNDLFYKLLSDQGFKIVMKQ